VSRPGVDTVLLDLDGTLYEGSRLVPGAPEAVAALRAAGLTVRFTTNTDAVPPAAVAERLAGFGIEAEPGELVTPVAVAARLLAAAGGRALVIASAAVRAELAAWLAGPGERPSHVVVADPSYGATYDDLDRAFQAVAAGAELVATQVNKVARRDDGEHLDTGGWVRLLEYASGATARVLGKPAPDFFLLPLAAIGRGPATTVVVGDDPATDIAAAAAIGAASVLVATGKGAGAEPGPPGTPAAPDASIASVAELPALLRGWGAVTGST
jgi:HAD superfamily hydrolase (TIGR01458 family)